ncbi:RipA family octameric membrane protein [Maribellus maritimus]|uniref:RipA family octameric membrane protein n=1 Tax=Maribellus maritimus TaxID=2870838 RepID=UPI001EE9EFA0|nr:hypothetical protein [Maribellus maritimus]MCG6188944.1 hypothetical protein [Maribellus maritimus]
MHLSEEEYYEQFSGKSEERTSKHYLALERAWKNRDFEIELYWKRATYFWGFIAASFAGYFILVKTETGFTQAEYIVTCLGFIFSLAWYFANIGSKKWQENWEKHIDMLEEKITGPIYKTVLDKSAYSVSKVNIRISQFVMGIWVMLAINYWIQHISFSGTIKDIDYVTIPLTIFTLYFSYIMRKEKRSSEREVCTNDKGEALFSFSIRNFEYNNPHKLNDKK